MSTKSVFLPLTGKVLKVELKHQSLTITKTDKGSDKPATPVFCEVKLASFFKESGGLKESKHNSSF